MTRDLKLCETRTSGAIAPKSGSRKRGHDEIGTNDGMSAKNDVNRRVLAIQAKKKRHKPVKRKGKGPQGDQENPGAQCSKASNSNQNQDTSGQRQNSDGNGHRCPSSFFLCLLLRNSFLRFFSLFPFFS